MMFLGNHRFFCALAAGLAIGTVDKNAFSDPTLSPTGASSAGHIEPAVSIPAVTLDKDGFPTGNSTPEGAACDLARAFIQKDPKLFMARCWRPGDSPKEYTQFFDDICAQMKKESLLPSPSPGAPKTLGKCFASRFLSMDGPASYGYAAYDLQRVMFVDVGVFLVNGNRSLNRTLVVEDKDHRWMVIPRPDLFSLLSAGLNDEKPSTLDFTKR